LSKKVCYNPWLTAAYMQILTGAFDVVAVQT
jgi:hypothetical protein